MSKFFRLKLYQKNFDGIVAEGEVKELITNVLKESGIYDESKEGYEKEPYRVVDCDFDGGLIHLTVTGDDSFDVELDEQLSNEFVIQVEMQNIKRWDPMHYSEAYVADTDCAWEIEYSGLRGRAVIRSGESKYPKEWQVFMDIIDAFTDRSDPEPDRICLAASYLDELKAGHSSGGENGITVSPSDTAKAIKMVSVLSEMGMPDDVTAAALMHLASYEDGFDEDFVTENYDMAILELMGLLGDIVNSPFNKDKKRSDYSEDDWHWELVNRVKESDSLYFKRVVLAEAMAELSLMRNSGSGTGDEFAAYYAGLLNALRPLEKDPKSKNVYKELSDVYKEIFVTFEIDSTGGMLYQYQSDAACIALKRGEYDWRTVTGTPHGTGIRKDLALFIASLWKREADEMILRDGNRENTYDVGNLKVLKAAVHKFSEKKDKAGKDLVRQILIRMMTEKEQILTAVRAAAVDRNRLENGAIENVNDVPLSFLGIESQDGKTYAALFTSMEERNEIDESDITGVPVSMVFEFVKEMAHLDGVVIDPFSDDLKLSNEEISDLLTLEKAERIKSDTAS